MAYTPLLGLSLPVTGTLSGTWGDEVNNSITSLVDSAVAGTTTLSTDADVTLTTTSGVANTAREAVLLCTGARTAVRYITAPAQSKTYTVINATTGGYNVYIRGAGPTAGIAVPMGYAVQVAWNSTDFVQTSVPVTRISGLGTGVATALGISVGTAGSPVVNGGVLGTPSSGTVTNLTGTASININGTVGATTPAAVSATSLTDSGNLTFTGTGNRITGDFSNATVANRVMFQNSVTNSGTQIQVIPNGTNTNAGINAGNNSDPTNGSEMQLYCDASAGYLLANKRGTGSYLPMTFYTGGSERVRVDTSGNVGIGNSSPGAKLDISGEIISRGAGGSEGGQLTLFNVGGTLTGAIIDVDTSNQLRVYNAQNTASLFYTNNTEKMRIDASGNVGIGTSSPATALHVKSGSGLGNLRLETTGALTSSSVYNYTSFYDTSGQAAYVGFGGAANSFDVVNALASGFLTFKTGGYNERMRIDASGNVGIGTTPKAWAAASRAVQVNASGVFGAVGSTDASMSANAYFDGINWKRINANAAWNLGAESTAGAPSFALRYAATGVADSNITWTTPLSVDTSGNVTVSTAALLGYGTGSGGTAIQPTSKSSPTPPINKPTGQITMNNAALAAGASVSFVVTNSLVTQSSTVILTGRYVTVDPSNYRIECVYVGTTGQFAIRVTNVSAGSLSEALLINFAVIIGAIA